MLELAYRENDLNTATLSLREELTAKISRLSPKVINISGLCSPGRAEVERFIEDVYAQSYGAKITVSYPTLMSVHDETGAILAAVGFRYAARESLFLEHYTGAPVEELLQSRRERIVEIGNLASAGGGASIFLFAALASYLHNNGIEYATATGTGFLHRYFRQLGLAPKKLCEAELAAVARDGQDWGTYYDTKPRVLAGSVDKGVRRLEKALGVHFEDHRPRLFPRLHYGRVQ
ncbi:MAG: hypothetical protein EOM26_11210 [Alphaproteobacteria bacterium]|nr:hypothetical protein [Alphaproteobacteria bacterium]